MFEGHQLHVLGRHWVFDLTTFIGYYVDIDDKCNKVKKYKRAYIVERNNENNSYTFEKMIDVPIRILKRTVTVITKYREAALLENERT